MFGSSELGGEWPAGEFEYITIEEAARRRVSELLGPLMKVVNVLEPGAWQAGFGVSNCVTQAFAVRCFSIAGRGSAGLIVMSRGVHPVTYVRGESGMRAQFTVLPQEADGYRAVVSGNVAATAQRLMGYCVDTYSGHEVPLCIEHNGVGVRQFGVTFAGRPVGEPIIVLGHLSARQYPPANMLG